MYVVRSIFQELPLRSRWMAHSERHELDLEEIPARTGRFTVPETGPEKLRSGRFLESKLHLGIRHPLHWCEISTDTPIALPVAEMQ
jgi:hypothetical protein